METMFEYTSCGLRGVFLRNGYVMSDTPYGEAVAIHDLEGLHRAIGLNIVRRKATLSPEEVRFLRKELDLSQAHLAKIFGSSESSVRNWESTSDGRAKISGPADRMLRTLYKEAVDGDGQVLEMLEHISEINRDAHKEHIELEETPSGWREAEAA